MNVTRDSVRQHATRRLRNQMSNILIFGTLISFSGAGLLGGAIAGVWIVGHTGLVEAHPLFKLGAVVLTTLFGFCAGVSSSFYVSPFVLRHAFGAVHIGDWKSVPVYLAEDENLPGGLTNIFVAGFKRGIGPFRPAIFASRSSVRFLDRKAIEAVFAHEISHLMLSHLRKRLVAGITTFIAASLLTSAMLLGMQWSGYTKISGLVSVLSGVVPAILTWLSTRNLLWKQEFEADENAIRVFGSEPEALLSALRSFQNAIGGTAHPLVAARMEKLALQQNVVGAPSAVFEDQAA